LFVEFFLKKAINLSSSLMWICFAVSIRVLASFVMAERHFPYIVCSVVGLYVRGLLFE